MTSGSYSYHFGHDIALALLPLALAKTGAQFEVPVLGERRPARLIDDSPYDPEHARSRM